MKWVFLLGLIVLTPFLATHLRNNPRDLQKAAFAIGILPFLLSGLNLTASPISWQHWPGSVKGLDVSLIDLVALAVLYATKPAKTPIALKLAFCIFLLGTILSSLGSSVKMAALFYVWQLLRAVLVYWAVARAATAVPGVPFAIVKGLLTGLVLQAIITAVQYAGGTPQAGGWFGHQNLLGLASHFAVYPAFALFLAGYYPKTTGLAVLSGLVVAFTGGSRATIGLFAIGIGTTLLLSMWHRGSGRKAAIGAGMVFALLLASPLLYSAIERRSSEVRAASNLERSSMINAAKMIITDYPLGTGPNHYVIVANVGGYSDRAGVAWNVENWQAPVHNTFYLVAAELGWLGLFGYLALLASIIWIGMTALKKGQRRYESEVLVGVVASIIVFVGHSYFEWGTMYYHIHYLLAINVGLLIGLRSILMARRSSPPLGTDEQFRERAAGRIPEVA